MSRHSASTGDEHRPTGAGSLAGALSVSPRGAVGALALLAPAATTLLRVARNAPTTLPPVVADAYPSVALAAALGPAAAAVLLGALTDDVRERVGLAFVGVFGPAGAFVPAAWLPAAGAVVGGTALAVYARRRRLGARRFAVAALVVVAMAASLAGAAGVASVTLRPLGSTLALLGVGLAPAFVRSAWPDWTVGALAALLALKAGLSAPFATGAVVLVGGAVVGTPLPVVALAVGGAVATAAAALRRRAPEAAVGVALLAVAGVPATLPRALAVCVGVDLLVASSTGGDRP
ncbi:phosphate ABC transporter permease [Halomarina pelagica]|uniref:phosphate ABC transporter permease n=1 Tax=Halomarina pelagica TaxID=2961599 RepID=UPI0020C38EC0|nr:phosphate ABC transporter permease [Halomarina sp. BND7]